MSTIENVKFFWKDLPKWAQGVALVAAIGIPSYIGYTIYKNKQDEKERLKRLEDMKTVDDTIKKLQNSGQKSSYEESQYKIFADDLHEAMNHCGTEVRKIYAVFDKMNNDLDVNRLISAYGVDRKLSCWASGGFTGGLASSLSSELGLSNQVAYTCSSGYRCNGTFELDILNCILSSKGIKTQF